MWGFLHVLLVCQCGQVKEGDWECSLGILQVLQRWHKNPASMETAEGLLELLVWEGVRWDLGCWEWDPEPLSFSVCDPVSPSSDFSPGPSSPLSSALLVLFWPWSPCILTFTAALQSVFLCHPDIFLLPLLYCCPVHLPINKPYHVIFLL